MKRNTILAILVAVGVPVLFFMLFEGGRGLPTKPRLPHFHALSNTDTQNNKITLKDTTWHTIGSFEWEGYHNKKITQKTLENKVCVTSFLSTKNPNSELVIKAYQVLYEKFKDRRDVFFLVATLSPQADPMPDLRNYADRFEVDSSRCLFASADSLSIYKTAVEQFKANNNVATTSSSDLINNPPIVLIDKNQTIRGHYRVQDADFPHRLISDLLILMLEYPEERPTIKRKSDL
ncbi:MAG: SCO family protein [Chitinophagales bacterium]|mgnify:CR=1 FL=1|jgi:protein SCO1/2|nr:SCO family protein [Chitinophagales bacterium]